MGIVSGGSGGSQVVQSATATLTDAQIKALPTTAVELVAAPGANKMLWLVGAALMFFDWTTNYTNIDAAALGGVIFGSGYATAQLSEPRGDVSDMLAAGHDSVTLASPNDFIPYSNAGTPAVHPNGGNAPADFANLPLRFTLDNGASGNLTGGNAANVLYITLDYTVLNV